MLHIGRYAFQFLGSGVVGKGIRRIQGVFAELLAQLCLALLNLREALFGCAGQFSTAQHKIANGVVVSTLLLGVERGGAMALYLAYRRSSAAQARPKLGDLSASAAL